MKCCVKILIFQCESKREIEKKDTISPIENSTEGLALGCLAILVVACCDVEMQK